MNNYIYCLFLDDEQTNCLVACVRLLTNKRFVSRLVKAAVLSAAVHGLPTHNSEEGATFSGSSE